MESKYKEHRCFQCGNKMERVVGEAHFISFYVKFCTVDCMANFAHADKTQKIAADYPDTFESGLND